MNKLQGCLYGGGGGGGGNIAMFAVQQAHRHTCGAIIHIITFMDLSFKSASTRLIFRI